MRAAEDANGCDGFGHVVCDLVICDDRSDAYGPGPQCFVALVVVSDIFQHSLCADSDQQDNKHWVLTERQLYLSNQ